MFTSTKKQSCWGNYTSWLGFSSGLWLDGEHNLREEAFIQELSIWWYTFQESIRVECRLRGVEIIEDYAKNVSLDLSGDVRTIYLKTDVHPPKELCSGNQVTTGDIGSIK